MRPEEAGRREGTQGDVDACTKELYNLHIYLCTDINLFPLNPNNTSPHNLNVVSSKSKNITIKERINSFSSLSCSHCHIRYLVLTNETRNKTHT